jgi:hypothetical protein
MALAAFAGSQHHRHAGSIGISIEQAHPTAASRQRHREIDAHRRFPNATFATAHHNQVRNLLYTPSSIMSLHAKTPHLKNYDVMTCLQYMGMKCIWQGREKGRQGLPILVQDWQHVAATEKLNHAAAEFDVQPFTCL